MRVRSEERPLLGALLPERVRWAEETGTVDGPEADHGSRPPWLFAEERALMARATPGRRREFARARLCAHRALAALGVAAAPLLRGPRGAPAWPGGTLGSITHCAGYRGAAVAPAARFLGLGIDAEPHAPLPAGVREAVVFGPEEARLRELADRRPDIAWDRLLFSAKESVYKAWSGYGGAWLGFEDAEVSWRLDGTDGPHPPARARAELPRAVGRFRARLLVPVPAGAGPFPGVLSGRWLVRGGLLLTAVAVPRPVPRPPHRTAPKEHR
ncbi:4'-phosphopantetheinyl transferase [Streptomyces sp. NK15101]|uniref:4'-phosphopantetheinyl transferase family protein n=1 Tax=Streptomyces sp. NK15101 TaxID=2873261 RepID=UPI001CED3A91|nr:4'-phosphopantetheinyl transferase superfamily protein [Streptomyces sp. NK15101]